MSAKDYLVNLLLKRRQAYRALFAPGPATDAVLADLNKFCRGNSAPVVVSPISRTVDPIATGIAIGRQEVWHRIHQHLNMSDADLYRIINQPTENDHE